MAGEPLASFGLKKSEYDHIGVKEAVFPFARFPGVDVLLGPEMKSTGEVIGLDRSFVGGRDCDRRQADPAPDGQRL